MDLLSSLLKKFYHREHGEHGDGQNKKKNRFARQLSS
jgi:hypothetical protein